MEQELKKHLLPLVIIFGIISVVWIIQSQPYYEFILLFFGLLWGSFLLDVDHIVYWLYLRPNLEESKLAQIALSKKDYGSVLKLLESTHKGHSSLIFHHYFFQIVLALTSLFVFTSSSSIFAKALLLSLNLHLLIDEIDDYQNNPTHLQNWLFAREPKQLAIKYLPYYIGIFSLLSFIFALLLLKS